MLHVTTEVGKVGRREREKRHFPQQHNLPSEPSYKARGRRYIPHNYGTDMDWVPHGQYIEPELTESGPDWASRLRYLPDPENPNYPAAEIWPNNWRSMRPYPLSCVPMLKGQTYLDLDDENNNNNNDCDGNNSGSSFDGENKPDSGSCPHSKKTKHVTFSQQDLLADCKSGEVPQWMRGTYKRSNNEWLLDPGLTKVGLRCVFNGEHRATATSENEVTHTMLLGKGRPEHMVDKRNELAEASPGDKSYQVPEYSPSFHKKGSTRPVIRYGPARPHRSPDTFIPLTPRTGKPREPFKQKEVCRQQQQEIDEVRRLESWKPATPLPQTLPIIDDKK